MSSTDLNSLERGAAPSRCRRLDACLVGSVLTLFVLVLAGFTAALLFAWSMKDSMGKLQETHDPQVPAYIIADADSQYKGKNFAFLRAVTADLTPGMMQWEPIPYGTGNTMGSYYTYNPIDRALTVDHAGSYFMYVQLNVSCTHRCGGASLTLSFTDQHNNEQLSCIMKLQANHPEPVVRKCWTVVPHLVKNSRLLAKIHSDASLANWTLEPNSSGFGIFLVDGP